MDGDGADPVFLIMVMINSLTNISTVQSKVHTVVTGIQPTLLRSMELVQALEAARAGEQGRGFAVVASEVRNLAQRSATAAKEIKALIEDSVEKVDEGSRLTDESGRTLKSIVTSVKKVSDIVAEIAAASAEQSAGIDQINNAITQMDQMTQQNAALVEQAAAASESMEEQARGLNELAGFFSFNNCETVTDSERLRNANQISYPTGAESSFVLKARKQAYSRAMKLLS
jgi:methyl-accepting chemotaxis protein